MHVEPFRIHVPDATLTDLRERLARTRFPDEIAGGGWTYGTNLSYLRDLVAYWRDRFDWRAAEARLNALPQFRADVDGVSGLRRSRWSSRTAGPDRWRSS